MGDSLKAFPTLGKAHILLNRRDRRHRRVRETRAHSFDETIVGTGVPDGPLYQTINFCKDLSVIFLFFVYIIIFERHNLSRTVGDAGPYKNGAYKGTTERKNGDRK